MTNTRRLAMLLADGIPRNTREIGAALGMTEQEVRSTVHELTGNGRIKRQPLQYSLTHLGQAFADKTVTPALDAQMRKRQHQKNYRAKSASKRTTIQSAIRSRTALESAWGGANA